MKKRSKVIFISAIILFTTGVILFARREKDYTLSYKIDGYEVFEKYQKNTKSYYFSVSKNDKFYEIAVINKYLHKKRLITNIDELVKEETECLYMKSYELNTYPICIKDGDYIAYHLSDIKDDSFYKLGEYKEIKDKLGNIGIYSSLGNNLAIWNHYGYDIIKGNEKEELTLLKKESYLDNYSFIVDNYILLPDYDQDYIFNKVYLINIKNGNTNTWDLDYNINYDFYVLGIKDKNAYIVDKKDKVEYELNPKNKKISVISKNGIGKIWTGKWEDESIIKLANGNYSFDVNNAVKYVIKNDKLTAQFSNDGKEIIVTNQKVDKIVKNDGLDVYYLSKNKLYYFSFYKGETLYIEYNEFEFNKGLSIYIY